MKLLINKIIHRLPIMSALLADRDALLSKCLNIEAEHKALLSMYSAMIKSMPLGEIRNRERGKYQNRDNSPWNHPFLSGDGPKNFRSYSDAVMSFAELHYQHSSRSRISCAFSVNMAQNMYKWGCLAQKYGVDAKLFLHPLDVTALSSPEWEEFDGEYPDLMDGVGFRTKYPDIKTGIPVHRPLMQGGLLYGAVESFSRGDRRPLLQLLSKLPGFRHEPLLSHEGTYPYFDWAEQLNSFDVIYTASIPLAAYFSGRPYCYFAVGGDLQLDCGRGDDYGQLMSLGVSAARFLMISNPHALSHSRRLGFTNGVYLPYVMDSTNNYCPGRGESRGEWEAKYGKGVYVLTTSRLDKNAKGFGDIFIKSIIETARKRPNTKFIFLAWGEDVEEIMIKIAEIGLNRNLIILLPVGKKKLIDYYRSCDIVLDHLVYGYYGATMLEAAAIGKPVMMKMRSEHYAPLYNSDVAPVINIQNAGDITGKLIALIDDETFRNENGASMREWLVRNHGEERTVPRMLALLRLAADGVPLPEEIVRMNPLSDDESEEEVAYHKACLAQMNE